MKSLLESFKKLYRRNVILEEEERIHPYRDWKRVLLFFVIFNFLIIVWSGYFYFIGNSSLTSDLSSNEEYLKTLHASDLEKIISPFKEREKSLNLFNAGQVKVVSDPAV